MMMGLFRARIQLLPTYVCTTAKYIFKRWSRTIVPSTYSSIKKLADLNYEMCTSFFQILSYLPNNESIIKIAGVNLLFLTAFMSV